MIPIVQTAVLWTLEKYCLALAEGRGKPELIAKLELMVTIHRHS
jgi:hypothetical protein